MKDIKSFLPDLARIRTTLSKGYELYAACVNVPKIGKVWILINDSFATQLDEHQYALKIGAALILAKSYPLNSYLVRERNGAIRVIESLLLLNQTETLLARRISFHQTALWELLDNSLRKTCRGFQYAISLGQDYVAEEWRENAFLTKHNTVNKISIVNNENRAIAKETNIAIKPTRISKFVPTSGIQTLTYHYEHDQDSVFFIDITGQEPTRVGNTSLLEAYTIAVVLEVIKEDGFNLSKDVGIITPFQEQKHLLVDFFAHRIGHDHDTPKIGLLSELTDRKFSVLIYSSCISNSLNIAPQLAKREPELSRHLHNTMDNFIYLGNARFAKELYGFAGEFARLLITFTNVTTLKQWKHPKKTHKEIVMGYWKRAIANYDPMRAKDRRLQSIYNRFFKNINEEIERDNLGRVGTFYKELLRQLGLDK